MAYIEEFALFLLILFWIVFRGESELPIIYIYRHESFQFSGKRHNMERLEQDIYRHCHTAFCRCQ